MRDSNGRKKHPFTRSCMLSDAWFRYIKIKLWGLKIKFKYCSGKLHYFRGIRFSQCFILSTAIARYQVTTLLLLIWQRTHKLAWHQSMWSTHTARSTLAARNGTKETARHADATTDRQIATSSTVHHQTAVTLSLCRDNAASSAQVIKHEDDN